MYLQRRAQAFRFAEQLRDRLLRPDWSSKLRNPASDGEEHKILGPEIESLIAATLKKRGDGDSKVLFDWEGNSARTWSQSHSYDLLGTSAHPDAAVVTPFTCAIEFDRETSKGASYFKERLMKASCHSLSGAYEATLFTFVLNKPGSTPESYLSDDSPHTARLLDVLRMHGVCVAVVPVA